ncbi:hypothetical protein R5E07_003925 [Vibrio vulnificus]|nr:hypothetical protein [Vibrio vulnificus]ELS9097767.1 hypothetical protein [Vibrio vulnificus]
MNTVTTITPANETSQHVTIVTSNEVYHECLKVFAAAASTRSYTDKVSERYELSTSIDAHEFNNMLEELQLLPYAEVIIHPQTGSLDVCINLDEVERNVLVNLVMSAFKLVINFKKQQEELSEEEVNELISVL